MPAVRMVAGTPPGQGEPPGDAGRAPTARLSHRNPRLQRLRRLSSDRRFRTAEGAFVVEGPHLVAEAVAAGLALEVYA
ncbi:MAG: hypothetical protein ABIS21_04825, partial [Acidimicrobiales bacterium]